MLSRSAPGTVRWADPIAEPPPPEALAGRDGVIHLLGRERRAAMDRQGKAADPRVARARHAKPRRGARAPDQRRATGARSCRCRRSATTARAATSAWTSARPAGDDFLAGVVQAWEAEARKAEELGVRVAIAAHGRRPGARAAARSRRCCRRSSSASAGPVAGGRQYVPWVHLDDVVGALLFLLDRGSGSLQRDGARAGHEQGALEGARPRRCSRPAVAPGPRARGQGALRRDGLHRHDGRARRARSACSRRATRSGGPTSTTPSGRRSAERARRRTARRADDRLLRDPREGVRRRAAHLGVLPLLLRGAGPVAARARAERTDRQRLLAYAAGVLFAIDLVAWHYSIAYIGAGLATVLGNLQVVLVGLTAWLVLSERPEPRAVIAVPPALIGIVLISGAFEDGAYGAIRPRARSTASSPPSATPASSC